ncbi:alpha/beta hydrolase [Halopelagius longus]|uniref:Acetyl esterase n=1 Tax=Halopelagius longus TaxID=1236180 RepID=A0A1H1FGW9_9EURY|nr:alpha/beta hydrolase [Halopelagius longus]RDI70114.1 alpha/beta hydrolase [Halopelagius longus]SDQ99979.1 acetyl esterase [Halopelagius longus]
MTGESTDGVDEDAGRGELHPDAQAFLEGVESRGLPSTANLSVESEREQSAMLVERTEGPDVEEVFDISIPGPDDPIPLRIYRPAGDDGRGVLVYFHGGGWVLGGLDKMDAACRHMAVESGRLVVSVNYRHAPEHPFPAGLRDCRAATRWVTENADAIGGDAERVAVGGDSSGGNLAAAVALSFRDFDGPALERQLLIYPATEHAFDTPSHEENASGYYLERADSRWFWNHYLGDELDGKHPYASPLRARDLSGLPPASVLTCGFDPIRDEGIAYARRLSEAGVPVRHHHYSDQIHAFVGMFVEPMRPHAEEALATMLNDLSE